MFLLPDPHFLPTPAPLPSVIPHSNCPLGYSNLAWKGWIAEPCGSPLGTSLELS